MVGVRSLVAVGVGGNRRTKANKETTCRFLGFRGSATLPLFSGVGQTEGEMAGEDAERGFLMGRRMRSAMIEFNYCPPKTFIFDHRCWSQPHYQEYMSSLNI